jgi:hypothetical protein
VSQLPVILRVEVNNMRPKTWKDFEKSFKLCKECKQPKGSFVGLFCKDHMEMFQEIYDELGYIPTNDKTKRDS